MSKPMPVIDVVTILLLASFLLLTINIGVNCSNNNDNLGIQSNLGDLARQAVRRIPGSVLPRPKFIKQLDKVIRLDPKAFEIVWSSATPGATPPACSIVEKAIDRYKKENLIFDDVGLPSNVAESTNNNEGPLLTTLRLIPSAQLKKQQQPTKSNGDEFDFNCEEWPHEDMDETYGITVKLNNANNKEDKPIATLYSATSWGFLRGLETFSQLVYRLTTPSNLSSPLFAINETNIVDGPRFKFRGFMLDTARHFISVDTIKRHLDAMSYNKLNVFHWHIVDDQSFPYVSKRFPQLSATAAFRPHMIYSQVDVANILEYARVRAIRVIPEFDTPGHSYGMRTIPGLLAKCYDKNQNEEAIIAQDSSLSLSQSKWSSRPNGELGPMDPTQVKTYTFISKLIEELVEVFPDRYFHAGGDEVPFDCWKSNPMITKWMKQNNLTTYEQLEGYYISRLLNILGYNKRVPIVWQEVFDNGLKLHNGTIVHVWKYINDPIGYFAEMTKVTQEGHFALLSSCWYLNYINYGQDWVKFYHCDPQDFIGTEAQFDLVLGGEACLWSEYVDDSNLLARSWPRAAATAERLWSPRDTKDLRDFSARVEQLRCRLRSRKIPAEPIVGPGFC